MVRNALQMLYTKDPFESFIDSFFTNDGDTSYPHYDIVKKNATDYEIRVAVAGFKREDLSVNLEEGVLTIRGSKTTKTDVPASGEYESTRYLHKGIAQRSFVKKFNLSQDMKVRTSYYEDGVLTVEVFREVPEYAKPRQILIESR